MSDHASFLAAIEVIPTDRLPRLVYADWLDEHGFPTAARLMRLELFAADLTTTEPDGQPRRDRKIPLPAEVADFHVYRFQHIDELRFMISAGDILAHYPDGAEVHTAIREVFTIAGWDGNGEVQALWFPPFVINDFGEPVDTANTCHGLLVWHVKQLRKGWSFIASPYPLPFPALLQQQ